MKKYIIIWALCLLVLSACNISPESIDYGFDSCHFCSMTLVDQQHAAQLVTKKGKAFKFDASECMINRLKEMDSAEVALFLVNDYNTPGELIDAKKATYLISKGIPSPMGEFLTAFSSQKAAEKAQSEHNGELFTWIELQERFKNK